MYPNDMGTEQLLSISLAKNNKHIATITTGMIDNAACVHPLSDVRGSAGQYHVL